MLYCFLALALRSFLVEYFWLYKTILSYSLARLVQLLDTLHFVKLLFLMRFVCLFVFRSLWLALVTEFLEGGCVLNCFLLC